MVCGNLRMSSVSWFMEGVYQSQVPGSLLLGKLPVPAWERAWHFLAMYTKVRSSMRRAVS
jgi:hypothetical protein